MKGRLLKAKRKVNIVQLENIYKSLTFGAWFAKLQVGKDQLSIYEQ
jgi:hypothetical protein